MDRGRREEEAGATIKLRTAARQVEELKAELASVKSDAAEKARQLIRHRDEVLRRYVWHIFFSPAQPSARLFFFCTQAGTHTLPSLVSNMPQSCHISTNAPREERFCGSHESVPRVPIGRE